MQYLTRKELNRVTARNNYQHRDLTKMEVVVKHMKTVNAMPAANQAQKAAKEAEVTVAVQIASELTSNDSLLAKIRLAAYNPAELESLLDGYPYVQFEGLLNGTEPFTKIESLACGGFSLEELQNILGWAVKLHQLYPALPHGVETFIWTAPASHYDFRAFAKRTGQSKFFGHVLPKALQEQVDELFKPNAWGNTRYMYHLRSFDLLNIPSIWARAQMKDVVADVVSPGVKIEFSAMTVNFQTFNVLSLVEEVTNTKLHFVVE